MFPGPSFAETENCCFACSQDHIIAVSSGAPAQPLVTPTRSIRCKKKRPLPLKEYRREVLSGIPAARSPSQTPPPHGLISPPRHGDLCFTSPISIILLSYRRALWGKPQQTHAPARTDSGILLSPVEYCRA